MFALNSPYFNFLEAYLEEDETVDAEVYVNKAAPIMYNIYDSASLQLRYDPTAPCTIQHSPYSPTIQHI